MSGTITPITMPKFGLAMTEGKLAGWLAQPGQAVSQGQELAEIETTKITNVYESPAAGTLRRQLAPAGETLPVGALIGVLAEESVPETDIDSFIASFQDSAAETQAGEDSSEAEPHLVEVGARSLRVQDTGAAGQEGDPLLFIHGFGGELTNWMMNQGALADKTRVIAFDLPGHGESSKDVGDGSPATLAAITRELLDTLGVGRVHVAAHSLGAAIALELTKAVPDRIASLTLVAPAGLGGPVSMAFIDGFITADRRKTLEPVLQMLVHDKGLISRQMVEGIIRFKRLDGAVAGLTTIARASFDHGAQKDNLRSVLEGFTGPAHVIWGEDDEILSPKDAQNLPAHIGVTLLPQTGHMPQMEKSADVNARLAEAVGQ